MSSTNNTFPGSMTLDEARVKMRPLGAEGLACPLCRQWVQIRRRNLANVHGRLVAALYAEHHNRFGHVPTIIATRLTDIASQGGYLLLGKHWGLIESESDVLGDQARDGHWRVTQLGIDWLLGNAQVPKYAEIYNAKCWGHAGDLVTREQVLGEQFDFATLRQPTATVPDALLEDGAAAA